MGTVRGNMGTVLEHVVLDAAVRWAVQTSRQGGQVRYLDTHAMAPLNVPVGRDFNLVDRLVQRAPFPAPPLAAQTYLHAITLAAQLRAHGHAACYPTHFLHAARSAAAAGSGLDAYLFENGALDAPAENRRAEIEHFLGVGGRATRDLLALPSSALAAELAPRPGDFRSADCWPKPSARSGKALVVFQDPLKLHDEHACGADMGLADLALLRRMLDERYLSPPELTVHVIFVTANLGNADYAGHADWIGDAWRKRFVPQTVPASTVACGGIKWGSFMMFLGCYDHRHADGKPVSDRALLDGDGLKTGFDRSLERLSEDVRGALWAAHRADLTVFRV
jgi:hypothetical protein